MAKTRTTSHTNLLKTVKIGRFSLFNMRADEVLIEFGVGEAGAEVFLPPVVDAAGRIYSLFKFAPGWVTVKRYGTDSCSIYRGEWLEAAAKDAQFTWKALSPIVLYSDGVRWYVMKDGTTTWP